MKSKKAQLGKFIVSLPVMIIIVVIMGIFIALSATASLFKISTFDAADSINPEESLLLKSIQIEIDGKQQQTLVFDAITIMLNGYISPEHFKEKIKPLVNEQHPCIIVLKNTELIAGYVYKNNQVQIIPSYFSSFIKNPEQIQRIKIEARGQTYEMSAYYGDCKYE
ncbi:hypothetical protein J4402_05685 [Candidatus Pacearchaeota archaeon]|nr:hypothetical protein [Candidatus Pacearchaeota archaeon]